MFKKFSHQLHHVLKISPSTVKKTYIFHFNPDFPWIQNEIVTELQKDEADTEIETMADNN